MKLVGLFVASSHGQLLPKLEFKGMPVPGPDRSCIESLFLSKILVTNKACKNRNLDPNKAHLLNLEPVAPQTTTTSTTSSTSLDSDIVSTVSTTTTVIRTSSGAKTTTEGIESIEEFLFSMENEKAAGTSGNACKLFLTREIKIWHSRCASELNLSLTFFKVRSVLWACISSSRLKCELMRSISRLI